MIRAKYPGASAKVVEDSVTQIIEQNMKGLDGLIYMSATSEANGSATITLTFDNAHRTRTSRRCRCRTSCSWRCRCCRRKCSGKASTSASRATGFLHVIGFVSEDGSMTANDISDYVVANLVDPLSRVAGVGNVQVFGAQYAMRIWLDPNKLDTYGLATTDIDRRDAGAERAGRGRPARRHAGGRRPAAQRHDQRAGSPADARAVPRHRRAQQSGRLGRCKLGDVARVELGAETYEFLSRFNGQPAAGMAISLATGANALATAPGRARERWSG